MKSTPPTASFRCACGTEASGNADTVEAIAFEHFDYCPLPTGADSREADRLRVENDELRRRLEAATDARSSDDG